MFNFPLIWNKIFIPKPKIKPQSIILKEKSYQMNTFLNKYKFQTNKLKRPKIPFIWNKKNSTHKSMCRV